MMEVFDIVFMNLISLFGSERGGDLLYDCINILYWTGKWIFRIK
jgi:hypothetical protein